MFIQYKLKACTAFFFYLIQLDLRLFALQVFLRKKCQGFINKKSYFFNIFFSLLVWELDCNVVYLKHCLFSLGAIQMKMGEWCCSPTETIANRVVMIEYIWGSWGFSCCDILFFLHVWHFIVSPPSFWLGIRCFL